MKICQIERPLVSTNRIGEMEHKLLQVVKDGSARVVAVDPVGCKPGDWVICVGSSAAREAAGSKAYPSDLTVVGIIDHWPPESDAEAAESEQASASESQAASAPNEDGKKPDSTGGPA